MSVVSETAKINRIVSIASGDGWWSRISHDLDEPLKGQFERVVVWAAVELEWPNKVKNERVIPVGRGDRYELSNYPDYSEIWPELLKREVYHESDFAVVGVELKPFDEHVS
jgi:hypothetical protein